MTYQFKRHTQRRKWLIPCCFFGINFEQSKLRSHANVFHLSRKNHFIACIWHGQTTWTIFFYYGPLRDEQFHQTGDCAEISFNYLQPVHYVYFWCSYGFAFHRFKCRSFGQINWIKSVVHSDAEEEIKYGVFMWAECGCLNWNHSKLYWNASLAIQSFNCWWQILTIKITCKARTFFNFR